jgi:hypothetical protein
MTQLREKRLTGPRSLHQHEVFLAAAQSLRKLAKLGATPKPQIALAI